MLSAVGFGTEIGWYPAGTQIISEMNINALNHKGIYFINRIRKLIEIDSPGQSTKLELLGDLIGLY